MTPKSVKKKMKTAAFAAAVSRDDLTEGAAELGVDFDEHLATVIEAAGRPARRADARIGGPIMSGDLRVTVPRGR